MGHGTPATIWLAQRPIHLNSGAILERLKPLQAFGNSPQLERVKIERVRRHRPRVQRSSVRLNKHQDPQGQAERAQCLDQVLSRFIPCEKNAKAAADARYMLKHECLEL